MSLPVSGNSAPVGLKIVAGFVTALVLVLISYLVIRAFSGDLGTIGDLVLRRRNLVLLWNTVSLAVGVLMVTTLLAVPYAWLTSRCDIRFKGLFTIAGALPLAMPAYVLAYAWLSLGGDYGILFKEFGWRLPRMSGYFGSLVAIGSYTFPYMYLNLRAAMLAADPALEESGRSLGVSRTRLFYRVILPQLRPAWLAAAILVMLHVFSDFGAVSLMRFETYSYAIYLQYVASFDRIYAAWLALLLIGLTGAVLYLESRALTGFSQHRISPGNKRAPLMNSLGMWGIPSYTFMALTIGLTVMVPLATLITWIVQSTAPQSWPVLLKSTVNALGIAVPTGLICCALAVPLAVFGVRHPGAFPKISERIVYLAYAMPSLALALAFIFVTLRTIPVLYQTTTLLVIALVVHFLAEAIGPIRTALYQSSPRLEEASRALGLGPMRTFFKVTFPVIKTGVGAGLLLIVLSVLKELPLTFLLAPAGFETLATNVWTFASEARFAAAAPFSIAIVLFSALLVRLLIVRSIKIQ